MLLGLVNIVQHGFLKYVLKKKLLVFRCKKRIEKHWMQAMKIYNYKKVFLQLHIRTEKQHRPKRFFNFSIMINPCAADSNYLQLLCREII